MIIHFIGRVKSFNLAFGAPLSSVAGTDANRKNAVAISVFQY
jgi:hypothetical protein